MKEQIPLPLINLYHRVQGHVSRLKQGKFHIKKIYWSDSHSPLEFDLPLSTTSMVCNQSFFDMPFFQYWARIVHENFVDLMRGTNQLTEKALAQPVVYHRKLWEFVYILQALHERGLLTAGKKGVGFGVGAEALVSIFAASGCEVLATDLEVNDVRAKGWVDTMQNVGNNIALLNKYGICPEDVFEKNVSWRAVNMNDIPADIIGYDFCWSACALEHLGSIESGLRFIKNSLKTLKPGGIAVHTTEYNVSSDTETLDNNPSFVLFRRQDIERLKSELTTDGHYIWPIDYNAGNGMVDNYEDFPPYSRNDMHLKLRLGKFTSTSIGLIIQKGAGRRGR